MITGVAIGSVYGIVALGLVIIFKSSGVFNIAQGEIVMLMAYVCYLFSVQLGLPFFLAAILTVMCGVGIGFLMEMAFLRAMIGQPMLSVIMMTIGIALITKSIPDMLWGAVPLHYPHYLPKGMVSVLGANISPDYLYGGLISIILFIALLVYFRYTRTGISMRAVADDQTAARSMGVNVGRTFGVAWALSCLVSAAGGIVLATITTVSLSMASIALKAWPVVIIGGMESIPGAIIGGLLLGLLECLVGGYLDVYFPGIKDVFPFIILLIVLFIMPYGLFGLKRIERL